MFPNEAKKVQDSESFDKTTTLCSKESNGLVGCLLLSFSSYHCYF